MKTNKVIFGKGSFKDDDFALTPYIFIVCTVGQHGNYYGLGIAWGWWGVFAGIAIGVGRFTPGFIDMDKYGKP
jgi:hypothetical protein